MRRLPVIIEGEIKSGKTALFYALQDFKQYMSIRYDSYEAGFEAFSKKYYSTSVAEYGVLIDRSDPEMVRGLALWDLPNEQGPYVGRYFSLARFSTFLSQGELEEDVEMEPSSGVVVWCIDATRIAESVNYINENISRYNVTAYPNVQHFLVITKVDLVKPWAFDRTVTFP